MLHTKFRGNRPPVPEKMALEGLLPYMGGDQNYVIKFSFFCTGKLSYKI